LSAQTCSLSSPAEAATWGAAKYGLDQLAWFATRACVMLSMCDTVTAKVLFWLFPMTVSFRFVARLEKYRRSPLSHENPPGPGAGPNATPVSLRERRPFS
jgi:hypothetical protein